MSKHTRISATVCFALLLYVFLTLLFLDAFYWSHSSHPEREWFALEGRLAPWQAWLAFLLTRSTWYFLLIALVVPILLIAKDSRLHGALAAQVNRIAIMLCVAVHPFLIIICHFTINRMFFGNSTFWQHVSLWFLAPIFGVCSWVRYMLCGG